MSTIDRLQDHGKCCACQGPIGKRLNICTLNYRATWKYPVSCNVITGDEGRATAICCDACIDAKREILRAIELEGDEIRYHPVSELESMPPEKSYFIMPPIEGRLPFGSIQCLLCGLVSYSQADIEGKYCGHCHIFHED